ncbi:MAG: N-acetyltransferase family protein [Actinomycetota bacterium]
MDRGARRAAILTGVELRLDPPLDDATVRRLVEVWVDVSNAGGAVGFPPPPPTVAADDVGPVAEAAFAAVRGGRDHIVVAYESGTIAGFAFLEHRPGPLFRHWATVKRLQVHPSAQGRGIGTELLRACAGFGRELGLEHLHLTVRGGTGTEAFYEAEGYEPIATIPDAIRLAPGDTRPELYMVKRL